MALTFDLSKIDNFETLCYLPVEADREGRDTIMNPVTEALIFTAIPTGTREITAENAGEVWARVSMWQTVKGAMVVNGDGSERLFTPEDIRQHVGLKTNVSPVTATKFNNSMVRAMRESAAHAMKA